MAITQYQIIHSVLQEDKHDQIAEIFRFHVNGPELWTGEDDKRPPRALKEIGRKWAEFEGISKVAARMPSEIDRMSFYTIEGTRNEMLLQSLSTNRRICWFSIDCHSMI
jgi:hypothetical protein